MTDEPVAACPNCAGAAQRLLSAGAGFIFKGDGFYITDNRSDAYKKKAEKDTGASPSGDAASKTSGSDSKSESSGSTSESKGGASETKTGGGKGSSKSGGDD